MAIDLHKYAQQVFMGPDYEPRFLRARVAELEGFLREFLTPEGFGYSVTKEVRNEARRLLGMKERES